jgi:folate-binding protein YgfZ
MPDIPAEYRIITSGAGWVDRSRRGRLRVTGRDAAAFLQGLLTNDVAAIGPGTGAYALLLTPQARVLADVRVYNRGDALAAVVEPGLAADLAVRFDSMIFAEDVQVTDVSEDTSLVTVVGTRAAEVAGRALGLEAHALAALARLAQVEAGPGAFVARADESDLPMFDLWVPAGGQLELVRKLEEAGAEEVSPNLADVLRIEAASPRFGVDLTSETIPLEAGLLDRGISTTKGCYVGQEVIVRVLHRGGGRVARRLVQMAFDREATIMPGQPLRTIPDAASEPVSAIGHITSAAFSPGAGRVLALGYVKRNLAEPGARVEAETGGGWVKGEIVRLAG